ncbi:carbon-nitrogen hydrolase family protein [bacterium]|nr:carbon-nitrogen hydrolase family protein [bacterium]
MKEVTVAGVQISVYPNNIDKNIEKIVHWYKKSVKETKAKLVVFPETVTTGFSPGMPLEKFYEVLPMDIKKKLKPIMEISKKTKTSVIIPTYEKTNKKNVIYNSAFFIRNGEIVGKYRKTHLFPTERITREGGWSTYGNDYPVFDTDFGKVGIMICYDGDFPEIARILAIKGAEIIARPSALLRSYDIWEMTNKARAYDNHTYIIAVNSVGPDNESNYFFGHSMIVSPIARKLALARGSEEIIYAKLDPKPIKKVTYGSDAPMLFDHLEDRNIESYKNYLTKKARSNFEPHKRIKGKKK